MDTHADAPQLCSLDEAARRLDVSIWTVRKWAAAGKIATVKLGTRVLVSAAEMDRIVATGTRPARPESQR